MPPDPTPVLGVVSGMPTDEELAAVSVVLLALAGAARAARADTTTSGGRLRWDGWTPAGSPGRGAAAPARHRTMWL